MEEVQPMTEISSVAEEKREEMVRFLVDLCSIPSVNPGFGGSGEYRKGQWLRSFLEKAGFPVEVIEVDDDRVPEKKRLNLLSRIKGADASSGGMLWMIGHLDTVGYGDLMAWETDPKTPTVKGGRIYGRGVEDNGQAIVCMVYAAKILHDLGLVPRKSLGLAFVSDEELGSEKGLKTLLQRGIFAPSDEALVPDAGSPDGSFIETAEKSILWCQLTTYGKETHASWPHQGKNAGWVGSLLGIDLINTVRDRFCDRDPLFDPPYSTFELTQKFSNVESPNVIPGLDRFVVDFRVLPQWNLGEVVNLIEHLKSKWEYRCSVRIESEYLERTQAPAPTPSEASIVKNLAAVLHEERKISPRIGGIGGGTCAALLREKGIPSVVWATLDETAHEPNEYAVIDNIVADTKVLLKMMLR